MSLLDIDDFLDLGDITSGQRDSTSKLASIAANAVVSYIIKNNKTPTVGLNEVLNFQKSDGALSKDGIWGPNARKAAAWYMNQKESLLPGFNTKYAKVKVTWVPPVVTKPLVSVKKSKTITAAEMTNRAAHADKAKDTVNKYFKKTGEYPKIAIREVREFQHADKTLTEDGLWGPNTRTAVIWYQGSVRNVPSYNTKFASSKITWVAPTVLPKPVTSLPIVASSIQAVDPIAAKPKITFDVSGPTIVQTPVTSKSVAPIAPVISLDPIPAPILEEEPITILPPIEVTAERLKDNTKLYYILSGLGLGLLGLIYAKKKRAS